MLSYLKENAGKKDDVSEQLSDSIFECLIRLVAVRLVLFEEYNVNLDYLIAELAQQHSVRFDTFENLADSQTLLAIVNQLDAAESEQLEPIILFIFALKRKRLSEEELKLLSELDLDLNAFKTAKTSLDQFQLPVVLSAFKSME